MGSGIFCYFKHFRYTLSIENSADNSVGNIVQIHLVVGRGISIMVSGTASRFRHRKHLAAILVGYPSNSCCPMEIYI